MGIKTIRGMSLFCKEANMSHKTLAKIAVLMLIVFGSTIFLYPTLFNPDSKSKTPIEAPPVAPARQ